jgi:hypothetical protein
MDSVKLVFENKIFLFCFRVHCHKYSMAGAVSPVFFYQCHIAQASSVGSPSGRPGGKGLSIIFYILSGKCCGLECLTRIRIFFRSGSRISDSRSK